MAGKTLDHDTRIIVIHKLGLQTLDIVKETSVSEQSVCLLVAKFKEFFSVPDSPNHHITDSS